jgi:hypothetical protein
VSKDYLVCYQCQQGAQTVIGNITLATARPLRGQDIDAVRAEVRRLNDWSADASIVIIALSPLADSEVAS